MATAVLQPAAGIIDPGTMLEAKKAVITAEAQESVIARPLYLLDSSFLYEVTFEHSDPLGLDLSAKYIEYSGRGTKSCLSCLVVVSTYAELEQTVHPGDIALRINDEALLAPDGSSVAFASQHTIGLIKATKSPRTLRFLRCKGSFDEATKCIAISTAELKLLASERAVNCSAKFSVTSANGAAKLVHADPQSSLTIKKIIQQATTTLVAPDTSSSSGKRSAGEMSSTSAAAGGGVYKEHTGKFVSVNVPMAGSATQNASATAAMAQPIYRYTAQIEVPANSDEFYLIGKFDTEEEAVTAYKVALNEVASTGTYVMRPCQYSRRQYMQQQQYPLLQSQAAGGGYSQYQQQPYYSNSAASGSTGNLSSMGGGTHLLQPRYPAPQQQSYGRVGTLGGLPVAGTSAAPSSYYAAAHAAAMQQNRLVYPHNVAAVAGATPGSAGATTAAITQLQYYQQLQQQHRLAASQQLQQQGAMMSVGGVPRPVAVLPPPVGSTAPPRMPAGLPVQPVQNVPLPATALMPPGGLAVRPPLPGAPIQQSFLSQQQQLQHYQQLQQPRPVGAPVSAPAPAGPGGAAPTK